MVRQEAQLAFAYKKTRKQLYNATFNHENNILQYKLETEKTLLLTFQELIYTIKIIVHMVQRCKRNYTHDFLYIIFGFIQFQ